MPVVHAEMTNGWLGPMDCRIKSGHDEIVMSLFH